MSTDRPMPEQIAQTVREQIGNRLKGRYGQHPALVDAHTLQDLGLDSLDVHELVDSLETALGLNPFEQALSVNDVRTVGDFCRAYTAVVAPDEPVADDAVLLASRRRAEARRRRQIS